MPPRMNGFDGNMRFSFDSSLESKSNYRLLFRPSMPELSWRWLIFWSGTILVGLLLFFNFSVESASPSRIDPVLPAACFN